MSRNNGPPLVLMPVSHLRFTELPEELLPAWGGVETEVETFAVLSSYDVIKNRRIDNSPIAPRPTLQTFEPANYSPKKQKESKTTQALQMLASIGTLPSGSSTMKYTNYIDMLQKVKTTGPNAYEKLQELGATTAKEVEASRLNSKMLDDLRINDAFEPEPLFRLPGKSYPERTSPTQLPVKTSPERPKKSPVKTSPEQSQLSSSRLQEFLDSKSEAQQIDTEDEANATIAAEEEANATIAAEDLDELQSSVYELQEPGPTSTQPKRTPVKTSPDQSQLSSSRLQEFLDSKSEAQLNASYDDADEEVNAAIAAEEEANATIAAEDLDELQSSVYEQQEPGPTSTHAAQLEEEREKAATLAAQRQYAADETARHARDQQLLKLKVEQANELVAQRQLELEQATENSAIRQIAVEQVARRFELPLESPKSPQTPKSPQSPQSPTSPQSPGSPLWSDSTSQEIVLTPDSSPASESPDEEFEEAFDVPSDFSISVSDESDELPLPAPTPPVPAGLQIFDADQRTVIADALNPEAPKDEVLISKYGLNITRKSIRTLADLNWLDDEVINFYMNLLMERSEQQAKPGLPRVYAFNTFFIGKLLSDGHAGVSRWTSNIDVFGYDLLLAPVHMRGVHWSLVAVDFRDRSLRYYDSLLEPNFDLLLELESYLIDEHMDKKQSAYNTDDWKMDSMSRLPMQKNGSDCGVFACAFAETLSRGAVVAFTQKDMPSLRMKMVLEICTGEMIQ